MELKELRELQLRSRKIMTEEEEEPGGFQRELPKQNNGPQVLQKETMVCSWLKHILFYHFLSVFTLTHPSYDARVNDKGIGTC